MQTGVMKGQAMGYDKYWNLFFYQTKELLLYLRLLGCSFMTMAKGSCFTNPEIN